MRQHFKCSTKHSLGNNLPTTSTELYSHKLRYQRQQPPLYGCYNQSCLYLHNDQASPRIVHVYINQISRGNNHVYVDAVLSLFSKVIYTNKILRFLRLIFSSFHDFVLNLFNCFDRCQRLVDEYLSRLPPY